MDAQRMARIATASASLIGAYMIGRSMGDRREPPRLGRDPADRKETCPPPPKAHAWEVADRWYVDQPFIDHIQPRRREPGPTVAEHRPADGWKWFDMRKFPLKARRIDVPPIRGRIGALFEVAPAPELGASMWALDYYGAIELGPIYLNMDDAQHGRGYLGILG